MNSTAAPMGDEDIYAFRPLPQTPAAQPAPRQRRVWPWVLGGIALLWLLLAVAGIGALASLLDGARDGVDISINGHAWEPVFVDPEHGVLALLGVAAALLAALVVVPIVVALALAAGLASAALGIGIAVLAVTLVVLCLTSPLWLIVLLLWLVLRRRPARMPA